MQPAGLSDEGVELEVRLITTSREGSCCPCISLRFRPLGIMAVGVCLNCSVEKDMKLLKKCGGCG
jgi:hypothetical protein